MKSRAFQLFLLFCICIAALPGCEDTAGVAGEYAAVSKGEQGQRICLQLDQGGHGSWTTEDDRITFKWESQSGQILLHTEAGAVIQGRLSKDEIEFTVPGAGTLTFRKEQSEQH